MFAPVRTRALKPLACTVFARASERTRTRANAEPCHSCHASGGTGTPRRRGSAACVDECHQGADRVALELQRSPAVAEVAAFPELAVGEACEEAPVCGEECVGHCRQRLG